MMKIKWIAYLICILTFAVLSVRAEEKGVTYNKYRNKEYVTMPINISFFPGFSIGESMAGGRKIINQFSLNVLAGRAARLRGVEFGGIWNDYSESIQGVQFGGVLNTVRGNGIGMQYAGVVNLMGSSFRGLQGAGVANLVDGEFLGFQSGGVINIIGQSFEGLQIAGVTNLVKNNFVGVQLAGVLNIVEEHFNGAQTAGVVNLSNRAFRGVQIGGVLNRVEDNCNGIQIAGVVNVVEGTMRGVQVSGLVNFADKFEKGIQLGVINITNEQRGLPIGVVTIARNRQYAKFELAGSEVIYPRIAFKLGVSYFYNIFSFGKLPEDQNRWMYGFGFGTEKRLTRRLFLNIEAMSHQELWIDDERVQSLLYIDRLHMLNQLKINFGIPLTNRLIFFAGPTFNVLVANHDDDEEMGPDLSPDWTFYEKKTNNGRGTEVKMWIGFSAGLRF